MKLVELRWTPYAVPFTAEFATTHGGWQAREGTIVRLRTNTGVTGVGEIAPLPSHGTDSQTECLSALERIATRLLGDDIGLLPVTLDELVGEGVRYAPLRCGMETAALDALARAEGVSVASLLSKHAARDVAVNALVDAAACADASAAAARAVACGFREIKLKVGVASSMAEEVARVAAVRNACGPDIRLRIDANGAWTEEQAIATLRAIEPCDIDLVEQPVPPGDIAALCRVRAAVRTPIAADESVGAIETVRALIDAHAIDAIVVKLPVAGGVRRGAESCELALGAGLDAIVTSALDCGIGVAAALQLAAMLPPASRGCGLATLGLLEDDLIVEELRIADGRMEVPRAPGIGVTLDEDSLARYAVSAERVMRA